MRRQMHRIFIAVLTVTLAIPGMAAAQGQGPPGGGGPPGQAHAGLSGDHSTLLSDHTGLDAKLEDVLDAIANLPAGGAPPCGAGTVAQRFVVAGTEVCDNSTGLVWQQNPDNSELNQPDALAHCPTLGDNYRLPFVKELISLLDYSEGSNDLDPALPDGHPFTNVELAVYWSATTSVSLIGNPAAWDVTFTNGFVGSDDMVDENLVWCVRGGS